MTTFLTLFGATLWLICLATCTTAKGAIHEIEGLLFFLTGSLFMCAGVIVQEIQKLRDDVDPSKHK